jgi:beta-galactosidase
MSIKEQNLPAFPYGAVYYRVSNPPKKDWERDYKTASEDSNNIFRHWFLWSAIERSPGKFTWDDYDRQLDLAAENGIKTIIAEMITVAPEWTARLYPHARLEHADGHKTHQGMHGSCATGGINMCLDNDDLREKAKEFLTRLAERYKDHPGLGGYDIWNECNLGEGLCYCPGTREKYRDWLQEKYGSLEVLHEAWWRPGLAEWEDVVPPRKLLPYNDSLDWLEFRLDNSYRLMKWRAEVISAIDPNHRMTAHGLSMSLKGLAPTVNDDWRAAEVVESYGLTWGSSRHGDEQWKQPQAMDLIRNASRGKPFWHAEAYGGPLWLASNVIGKPRDEGRICYPEDIRYWNLTSYMHGAVGTLFLRWRPLLDGVLFGAFGPYGMDGGRTDRSDMSTSIAKWAQAPEQKNLWKSRPVKGEVGIIFVPESQIFTYAQQHKTTMFSDCYEGAYRGFYDNNVQADFVHIDDIEAYDFLYLPYPVMLKGETASKIKTWVKNGGTLISEGCPAYWGDRAHVGETQPNLGLDEMFGAKESYVEFTPDILDDLSLKVHGTFTWGGVYLQCYEPTTGKAVGWYEDGRVAAVENRFGKGKTLLIGTMPGRGYTVHDGEGCGEFFKKMFAFGRESQAAERSDDRIRVRVHDGDGGTFLWIANYKRTDIPVMVTVSDRYSFSGTRTLRGANVEMSGNTLSLVAPGRDVSVIELVD